MLNLELRIWLTNYIVSNSPMRHLTFYLRQTASVTAEIVMWAVDDVNHRNNRTRKVWNRCWSHRYCQCVCSWACFTLRIVGDSHNPFVDFRRKEVWRGLQGGVKRVHTFLYALPMDCAEISRMGCSVCTMNTVRTYSMWQVGYLWVSHE